MTKQGFTQKTKHPVHPLFACANCDWIGPFDDLNDIKHYSERVDECEPDGECPACGCLAYEVAQGHTPDACQEGHDAHEMGKTICHNPYNTLQPEYAEWNNGWRTADNYEPPDHDGGRFEDSPRYRAAMIDAGRGRLLR